MVICVGSFAAIDSEPRQARKGATVAVDSGAEVKLAQVATKLYIFNASSSISAQMATTNIR